MDISNLFNNPKVEGTTATTLMNITDIDNFEASDKETYDDEEDDDSTQHLMFKQSHEPCAEKLKSVLHPIFLLICDTVVFQGYT